MENDVGLPVVEMRPELLTTVGGGDIGDEGDDGRKGTNGIEIDSCKKGRKGKRRRWVVSSTVFELELDALPSFLPSLPPSLNSSALTTKREHSPTMRLPTGMYLAATCSQPPGAAHKSMQTFDDPRRSYFLLS